jgi:hypothetical protein
MGVVEVSIGLPNQLRTQLTRGERVYYFSYIVTQGGCLGRSERDNYWIAITNKRVIYQTKIMLESNKIVTRDGILPLEQVSFIEVTEVATTGCLSTKTYALEISTSGGKVNIPIPSKEKGIEIRSKYTNIIEYLKYQ